MGAEGAAQAAGQDPASALQAAQQHGAGAVDAGCSKVNNRGVRIQQAETAGEHDQPTCPPPTSCKKSSTP